MLRPGPSFAALMPTIFLLFSAPWPARWRVLAVLALYAAYLPLSGYTVGQFRFDAAEYWELSLKFTQNGHFSLLAFDAPLRGYLGPLLVLPARLLCHFTGWSMLTGARVLGAGWAAVLFGIAVPQLWAQATGRVLSGGRWLVFIGLSFIFWRDYFNFTLSDMPALALLLLGIAALARRGWGWAAVAGLLLAAAINIRPIYLASTPGLLWLLLRNSRPAPRSSAWWRSVALVAGLALVLLPQLLINLRHFQQPTPLVLARLRGTAPLYLKQLTWGTAFQRYESSLVPESFRSLVYADSAGQRALVGVPGHRFGSYGQYVQFALHQPVATSGRYLRHLFNGLDVQFPTPYPRHLHPLGQAALRLLNYVLLGLGVWLALSAWRKHRQGVWEPVMVGTLLALLLPCLLVLPTLMETRFLLPLHLLVLMMVAGTWQPAACWRKLGSHVRRLAAMAVVVGWLWGCWQVSEATAGQLRPPSEAPKE